MRWGATFVASGVFEDRDGWHLVYRNQLIRVKTRRKPSASAMVGSQSSQPGAALLGSMDSVDEVFSVLLLVGGSRQGILGNVLTPPVNFPKSTMQ